MDTQNVLLHAYRLWKYFFSPMYVVVYGYNHRIVFIISSVKCVTFLAKACIRNKL
jgi:hypothetical protein